MKKLCWKELSLLFVYTAAALITISDTGIQLLLMKYGVPNSSMLREIALLLLFFKIAGTRYTKKEFLIFVPIVALSLYNYRLCGNEYCYYNILFVASLKGVDYTKLFKVLFFSTLLSTIFISLLSFAGIGGVISITQDYGRGSTETRYCFGFYHPNLFHQVISRCIIFFALAYYGTLTWKKLCLLFFGNLLVYTFTISRTGLLAVSVFLILLALYRYARKIMEKTISKICMFVLCAGTLIGYYLMLYDYLTYPTMFSQIFNRKFATGRLGQAAMYIYKNPFQLLGTRFPNDGTVVDCGFLRMISESGYLLGGLFLLCLFVLLFVSLKNNHGALVAVIFFTILYSLYEVFPFTRLPYNVPVFFFGLLLYPKHVFHIPTLSFSSDSHEGQTDAHTNEI